MLKTITCEELAEFIATCKSFGVPDDIVIDKLEKSLFTLELMETAVDQDMEAYNSLLDKLDALTKSKEGLVWATEELVDAVNAEFEFVREKHGVKGDDFSCPLFQRMAKATRVVEKAIKDA